jgi:hypothetical protein
MANNLDFHFNCDGKTIHPPGHADSVDYGDGSPAQTQENRGESLSHETLGNSYTSGEKRDNDIPDDLETLRANNAQLQAQMQLVMGMVLENRNSGVSLAKRYKQERDFKSLGNEAQHKLNANWLAIIDEIEYSLSVNNFTNVKNCLADLKVKIEERQIDILIADTSEFGWQTVNELASSGIGLNEDKDKCVKRAEASIRALRKQKAFLKVAVAAGVGAEVELKTTSKLRHLVHNMLSSTQVFFHNSLMPVSLQTHT